MPICENTQREREKTNGRERLALDASKCAVDRSALRGFELETREKGEV